MAFFGAFDGAIHPAFLRLASVTVAPHSPPQQDRSLRATRGGAALGTTANIPVSFDSPPTRSRATAQAETVVYAFGDAAALTLNRRGERNVALWDPVPLMDYWYRPLRDLMNNTPAPFALAAATLNRQLAHADAFRAEIVDLEQSGTVGAWRTREGTIHILAGNLEEGLRDDADRSRRLQLRLPANWDGLDWHSAWGGEAARSSTDTLNLYLPPQDSVLIEARLRAPSRRPR